MPQIELATALPGAQAFKHGNNVNDTFVGQILLEDGSIKDAIIKDLIPRELANELLTLVLAKAAGLPIPDGYLCLAPSANLSTSKGPSRPDGRLVFASVNVRTPNLTFRANGITPAQQQLLIQDVLAWSRLGGLYAFDTWVANIDRHPGNLLFGGTREVWLIDHGWCYTGPNWQAADLVPDKEYRHRLGEWLTQLMSADQKTTRRDEAIGFNAVIKAIDIAASSRDARLAMLLPEVDVKALEQFLTQRAEKVPQHTSKALGMLI